MRPATWVVLLWLVYAAELTLGLLADNLPFWGKAGFLLVGLSISVVVYYQQVYRPTIRVEDEYLGIVLNDLFNALIARHRDLHPGGYELRVNLMRVRRSVPLRPPYVRIDFSLGAYSDAELEQEYRLGVGNAGTAILRKDQSYYDSLDAHEPRLGLTATQREITAHINSILSTPVFRPNEIGRGTPIAVLNLDSTDPIRETHFRDPDVRALAVYYANTIGALLR
jgi:hypothetical protein